MKKLPEETQELIRSGIQLPSFEVAVAEVVHNSIDANSTTVAVAVDLPSLSFEVRDNGDGISPEDMALVFTRHASSKPTTGERHGFRGEALASIAGSSLSTVITSRASGSPRAFTRSANQGHVTGPEPADLARAVGTTVSVVDLFFRFPVRKKSPQLMSSVRSALEAIAIAHPNVILTLFDSAKGSQVLATVRVLPIVLPSSPFLSHSHSALAEVHDDRDFPRYSWSHPCKQRQASRFSS